MQADQVLPWEALGRLPAPEGPPLRVMGWRLPRLSTGSRNSRRADSGVFWHSEHRALASTLPLSPAPGEERTTVVRCLPCAGASVLGAPWPNNQVFGTLFLGVIIIHTYLSLEYDFGSSLHFSKILLFHISPDLLPFSIPNRNLSTNSRSHSFPIPCPIPLLP